MIRLASKSWELTVELSFDRSPARYLFRFAEESKRDAGRSCSAKTTSNARLWSPACLLDRVL